MVTFEGYLLQKAGTNKKLESNNYHHAPVQVTRATKLMAKPLTRVSESLISSPNIELDSGS